MPLLDSGSAAALGFAEESGIPYETALIRNHFVHRTFIEPAQSIRHFGVKVKHNAIRGILGGKRVVLVDDILTTGGSLLAMIPPIILFLLLQKYLVRGIQLGAVKG